MLLLVLLFCLVASVDWVRKRTEGSWQLVIGQDLAEGLEKDFSKAATAKTNGTQYRNVHAAEQQQKNILESA